MDLELDGQILALAIARMVAALANSFLIVVLPLYLGSVYVELPDIVGMTVQVGPIAFEVTTALLIGVVLSVFGFLNSFTQPVTGTVSDRTGRRKIFLLVGLALVAIGSTGYLLLREYWAIVIMRALQGLGAAFSIPVAVALVNELSASGVRGQNFGLFNTFRLVGFGIGPLLAGAVVVGGPYPIAGRSLSGFDAAFGVAIVGAAISFVLVWILISDPPTPTASVDRGLSIRVRNPEGGIDPVFALGVATLMMALSLAIYAPLANEVNARLGQGTWYFSVQFGATVLANVLLQVPIGRWSDRVGRRPFLVWGLVLLIPATIVQGYILSSLWMTVARFIQGIAVASVFAPALALAGDLAGEGASGSTLSVLTMGFGLGIAFGTLLSGILVGFGFAVPFLVAAGFGVVALVLVVRDVEEDPTGTPAGA
jgi:MFS family permease